MVKKLSALIFAVFGSVLILFGCGDPYKDLKLDVSTSNIVLYLNEPSSDESEDVPEIGDTETGSDTETDVPEDNPADTVSYPSEASFVIKVSGTGKNVSGEINIEQYAINGVQDIVSIEPITTDTTSRDGARYKVTAVRPGSGTIVVQTKEGSKRHEINVSVYVPIKGVSFIDGPKAVKYGSTVDLNQFLTFEPTDTNQKEMKFYIEDNFSSGSISDETGIIETTYAKIENGILTSKISDAYPVNVSGQKYVRIYAISQFNPNVKTEVIDLPVLNIVEESDITLTAQMETNNLTLSKLSSGYYEIVLGHNIPDNKFVYSRDVTLQITDEYTTDQQYVISTNYNSNTTSNSIFEMDSSDEQARYNYSGPKENYPYKKFSFSQLKTGNDVVEVYIDRRGYEGLFTITLKIRVTVKDFATSLSATDENGGNAITNGLVVYNAYGGNSLGTGVVVALSPNVNNAYKVRVTLLDVPEINGVSGITMQLVNASEITNNSLVDSGTIIYLKHNFDYDQLMEIMQSETKPQLQISYTFNLAPVTGMQGYDDYIITETIELNLKAGVTDIRIPAENQEIKINAVTGLAVNQMQTLEQSLQNAVMADDDTTTDDGEDGGEGEDGEEEVTEIILATIDNQPANLQELISSIKVLTVNGNSSNMDAMNNQFFNIVYKEGPLTGQYNRLVLEPKLQADQARIVLEIKTNNNITKTVVVDVFVPIVFTTADPNQFDVEIYNQNEVGTYIYDVSYGSYKVVLRDTLSIIDGDYEFSDEELPLVLDTYKYQTVDTLTLSVDSRVGLNFYNYVVLNNDLGEPKITRVNYNSNVTLTQNREYYTVEYETINGVRVPFIVTKKLKTNQPQIVEVRVVGYDNEGNEVTLTKQINLNIIEPVTSITLNPISSSLYTADSLGALKLDGSKLKFNVSVRPANASFNSNDVTYSFRNDVLYSLVGNTRTFEIRVEHLISLDPKTGEVQAELNQEAIRQLLEEYSIDSGVSIPYDQVINSIFANNVIVTFYATLQQYEKPAITASSTITIRNATKVEKIIPSTSSTGVYFDIRKTQDPNYAGETITFNVLPTDAYNKTLIVNVGDESVVQIVSGVDSNNRLIGNSITIKPNLNAGRTYIRVAAEDSYAINANTGIATPTSYLDISVRVADGTKQYPFEIKNANEFLNIANDFVKNSSGVYTNSYYYVLTQTFSIANLNFGPFNGVFNGGLSGNFVYDVAGISYSQQNAINGLTMHVDVTPTVSSGDKNVYYYGIFKELGTSAEIENLILNDVNLNFNITKNDAFTDEINIGTIAGVNYGLISNSSVNGKINITTNASNINVGGVVGVNLSHFNLNATHTNGTDSQGNPAYVINNFDYTLTGVITASTNQSSNFVSSQENSSVNIKFVGSSTENSNNINLGGVAGKVETYATHTINGKSGGVGANFNSDTVYSKDVSVYQILTEKTISNLTVASSIESVDETGAPKQANIGGVAGYSDSTIFDNVNVLTSLHGQANIGGIVGYANHSMITNSSVEFANQGQVGAQTISISGYTNVGGLVGYAKNINIYYSYARAYFNNRAIDNTDYFGNIALLDSNVQEKNVGGLVGFIDGDEMSAQLSTLGESEGFDVTKTVIVYDESIGSYVESSLIQNYNVENLINSNAVNGIFNSYFNADINVSFIDISKNIYVGGLVGNTTNTKTFAVSGDASAQKGPLTIKNSYVYGNIEQQEVLSQTITNKVEIIDSKTQDVGTFTTYQIGTMGVLDTLEYYNYNEDFDDLIKGGNHLVEIITETTTDTVFEEEIRDDKTVQIEYQIQHITFNVIPISQKLLGNQEFSISSGVESNSNEIVELRDGVAVKEITKTNTYSLNANVANINIVVQNSYIAVNDGKTSVVGNAEGISNATISIQTIISNETVLNTYSTYTTSGDNNENIEVDDANINRTDKNNTITMGYVDLTDLATFTSNNFSIIEAVEGGSDEYANFEWLLCAELNSGYPVLFKLQHNAGELLFKVLPTQITINIIDLTEAFSNLSYIKDGDNLVLLYNELQSGRAYEYVNHYKIVSDGNISNPQTTPYEVINVDLDIVDLYTKYGINADYDKNMVITSSNPTILSVENGNMLVTRGVGQVTLSIASKLDTTIYDTIEVLVVTGLSDFNIYKTRNVLSASNALSTINKNEIVDETNENYKTGAITQIIDNVSNYFVDTVNEDDKTKKDCNGVYAKNTNIGVMMEVSAVGNGQATLNGVALEKGATYLYTSMSEFSFTGTYEGLVYVTLTPFIITNQSGFGQTLTQTTTDGSMEIDNCILINDLQKTYKFNVIPKAESIRLDKTSVSLDPVGYVDVTLTTVTSDFVQTGEDISVNETINVQITDKASNQSVGSFVLDMSNVGTNSSFINIEILNEYARATDEPLKVELVHELRFSFDTEKYKDRTGNETYNLKDIAYTLNFYPSSNLEISANFDIQIMPRNVTEIKSAYYPNAETSSSGDFFPQENESDYIVPSRAGLLKLSLFPEFNNAEYVELTVNDEMKNYVNFSQQLAIMSGDENSFITGYRTTISQPDYLPNFRGIRLINQSIIVNGTNIYFTGTYFVQLILSENAPVNEQITFTATAYKVENNEAVVVQTKDITLTIQPLPSISITVDGQNEGLIAKGMEKEIEISAQNFEGDVEISVSTLKGDTVNASHRYDVETDKHFVNVGVNAQAGDTVIIQATASRYLNGILETQTSTVRLFIVEYLINGVRLEGSTYVNGGYQYEALNGTTNMLNVVFDITYNQNNTQVPSLRTALEQEASGKIIPDGAGGYINNWWRMVGANQYETLYSNTNYGDYEFVDTTLTDLSRTHYFGLKTIVVSNDNVFAYRMSYYYNSLGVPKLYTGIDEGYDVYEIEFVFKLVIKDNSTYDHPNPISNVAEFMALGGLNVDGTPTEAGAVTEGHYILVNDLVLENYFPFEANFSSLDGNGHVITINSINTEEYKTLSSGNVGLFETISNNTVIKNITIDVSNMLVTTAQANAILKGENTENIFIDLIGVRTFNFGVLAGQNNGSITNAKIINTKRTVMINDNAKNLLVASTTGYINGGLVEAKIGGLVGVNNGSISNSYVGLNAAKYENEGSSSDQRSLTTSESQAVITYPFNIVAGKSVGGFVDTNSGILANSYVLGVGVSNTGMIFEGTRTAGFVVENIAGGEIFNCMVEGLETDNYRAKYQAGIYLEAKGNIGGFIYSNAGSISNAYSNIPITTNSGGSGGFVYTNTETGTITNAYSTVLNANNSLAHGHFTGIDDKSNFNNFGKLVSCYYLVMENETENTNEPATAIMGKTIVGSGEQEDGENVVNDNPFRDTGSFNGFNFATGDDENNIWRLSDNTHFGPRLISSTMTTFSHRVLTNSRTDESTNQTIYDYEYDFNCPYGSNTNPLLVNSATEFVTFIINNSRTMTLNGETLNVFGVTTESQTALNTPHYIRLINDLDFSSITLNNFLVDGKRISDIVFVGKLDGNGMDMTGIRLVDQRQDIVHENFGLFSQVGLSDAQVKDPNFGSNNVVSTAIMNVNITISGFDATQSVKVGAVAGSMYNTSLINVSLTGGEGVEIAGRNLVGGIAGLIINSGSELITNVTTNNITVTASHRSESRVSEITKVDSFGNPYNGSGSFDSRVTLKFNSYYNNETNSLNVLRNYSYAGSIAGVIEANNRSDANMNIKTTKTGETNAAEVTVTDAIKAHRPPPINNLVSKITVKGGGFIAAEHAGGLFGYVGERTHIRQAEYILGQNEEDKEEGIAFVQYIMGHNYGGGIVGENYGMLEQVEVKHADKIQTQIDANLGTNTTVADEITNLFGDSTSIAIGGIAGFSSGSIILDSYSKVDVFNSKAKIAGGLVGILKGSNYISHTYTSGNVLSNNVFGGAVGLHNAFIKEFKVDGDGKVVTDSNGNKQTESTYTEKNTLFDYMFALNDWGTELSDVLTENLQEYYLKTGESIYKTFELRFPEIGNQHVHIKNADGYKNSQIVTPKFAGSLVGYLNNSGSASELKNISENDVYDDYQKKWIKAGENVNTILEPSRTTTVVNNGQGQKVQFQSVISTTLNSAKITTNQNIDKKYNNNTDYNQPVSGATGESGTIGDRLEFINYVGQQFKLDVILGKTDSNTTLFNMFIWDTNSMSADDGSSVDLASAGSDVWRLGDIFPRYIVGIYSNFNTIKDVNELYNQTINNQGTKNQYYLISAGTYVLNEIVTSAANLNAYHNAFEGTLIGVPSEGKNPKIVLNVESGKNLTTIFSEINTATIMNVDFEVNVNAVPSQGLINEAYEQQTYGGFFAKYVNSTVLSNVNFYINFKTSNNITYANEYTAIGLMIGYVNNSTLQNISTYVNSATNCSNTTQFTKKGSDAASKAISLGGIIGEVNQSEINNVNIIGFNNVEAKFKTNHETVNMGNTIGLANNSTINNVNDINNTSVIAGETTTVLANKNTNNNVLMMSGAQEDKTVNYGGIIGASYTTNLNYSHFKGSINYGKTALQTNLRFGGVVGYSENSTILQANVNDYIEYFDNGTILRTVASGQTFSVNNPNSNGDLSTFVGGVLGYGLNTKVQGNTTNKINTSNNTNITVTAQASEVSVGGIVGSVKNSNENTDVSRVYNTGIIKVNINGNNQRNINVGGIVGWAVGGKYESMYNLGEIATKIGSNSSSNPYAVGGILGKSETNSAQTTLKLARFVNFADITIGGARPDATGSNSRFVGGVAGQIVGTGSKFEGGYTLAKITNSNGEQFGINNQDNGAINGIAYVKDINKTTFNKVYFVFDFLPYSNFTNASSSANNAKVIVDTTGSTDSNYGGIEYSNLNKVLHAQLKNYFNVQTNATSQFVTKVTNNGNTTVTAINLPTVFKIDGTNVDMFDALSLINSVGDESGRTNLVADGEKLNPIYLNDTSKTTHTIDNTKHYIMVKSAVDGDTIELTGTQSAAGFKGLLTSESRSDYPTITLSGFRGGENYGILSNFATKLQYSGDVVKGGLLTNNYGNIINVVNFAYLSGRNMSFTDDVATFVYNNHANIVQSGSIVLFATDAIDLGGHAFSGFVNQNYANAFIKDCYSLSSVINTSTTSNTAIMSNASSIAGFANVNNGVIETSYFGGSLASTPIAQNVFVTEGSGTTRNCFYDVEATPVTTGATSFNIATTTSSDATSVYYTQTWQFMVRAGDNREINIANTFLKTSYVPSSWTQLPTSRFAAYNFAYPVINGGVQIPTLFTITVQTGGENPHSVNKTFVTTSEVGANKIYPVFHVGQLNVLNNLSLNGMGVNIGLLSNLDMSKVNFGMSGSGEEGKFDILIELNVNFYGFNHTINNLNISENPGNSNVGLFASIANGSTLEFLKINNARVNVVVHGNVGILVGRNEGAIKNVNVDNSSITATSASSVGGVVGLNTGTGSLTEAKVYSVYVTGNSNVGGAVGKLSNGTIQSTTVDNVSVVGNNVLGGVVGLARKESGDYSNNNPSISGVEVKGTTSVTSNLELDSSFNTIRNVNYAWSSNYNTINNSGNILGEKQGLVSNNIGGIVGELGRSTTLTNPLLTKISVTGHNVVGGVAGKVDTGARIVFTTTTISDDANNVKVNAEYNAGGIAGMNKGTIEGVSTQSTIMATVGINQTASGKKYNANIGGAVGSNQGGTISNIKVDYSSIYGSRLVGGIAGYSRSGRIQNSTFTNSTLYYNSEMDMDQHTGYMPNLKIGINSENANYKNNNFYTHLGGGGGDGKKGVFNIDKTKGYNVFEYGGLEIKVGTNKTIPGKGDLRLLFGFIVGGRNGGTILNISSSSSSIENIFDEFRNYIINVTDFNAWGTNTVTFERKVQKGVRNFKISTFNTNFFYGSDIYRKYTSEFEDLGDMSLKSATAYASQNNIDVLSYIEQLLESLPLDVSIFDYAYPNMTLIKTTIEQESDLGSHKYSARDGAFNPFYWNAWKDVPFYASNPEEGFRP